MKNLETKFNNRDYFDKTELMITPNLPFISYFDYHQTKNPKVIIKFDILVMRFLPTEKMFKKYCNIVFLFWDSYAKKFAEYFKDIYIKQYHGWQSFKKFRFPSTNNSLEAANR